MEGEAAANNRLEDEEEYKESEEAATTANDVEDNIEGEISLLLARIISSYS